jgi:hypothetical protein
MCLNTLDAVAQSRDRACSCAAHTHRSSKDLDASQFKENQKLVHLFMICSNIKLTDAEESIDVQRKLEILADAAKYDASCASSGTEMRDSSDGKGLGSTAPGMGICHSYAPDGRCISLLKVLLTNACNYDCLYCVNRTSSNVPPPASRSMRS